MASDQTFHQGDIVRVDTPFETSHPNNEHQKKFPKGEIFALWKYFPQEECWSIIGDVIFVNFVTDEELKNCSKTDGPLRVGNMEIEK